MTIVIYSFSRWRNWRFDTHWRRRRNQWRGNVWLHFLKYYYLSYLKWLLIESVIVLPLVPFSIDLRCIRFIVFKSLYFKINQSHFHAEYVLWSNRIEKRDECNVLSTGRDKSWLWQSFGRADLPVALGWKICPQRRILWVISILVFFLFWFSIQYSSK